MLYTKIAGLYSDIGNYQESLSAYKKAVKLIQKLQNTDKKKLDEKFEELSNEVNRVYEVVKRYLGGYYYV